MLHRRPVSTKDAASFTKGMQVSRNAARPLSPHLTIWKWGPHMLVSILHRATGTALAIGGGVIFTWWLAAAATSPKAYEIFYQWVAAADPNGAHPGAQCVANKLAMLVGIALTWSFFQHAASGVRHFVLDTGAGYELKINRMVSMLTIAFSLIATAFFWAAIWSKF
jgi:succinate dehydrogenase / fumarate reductase cytochrome b subunit